MNSHAWNCNDEHDRWDCPLIFPTSNVRVITAFDRHVDEAMRIANSN